MKYEQDYRINYEIGKKELHIFVGRTIAAFIFFAEKKVFSFVLTFFRFTLTAADILKVFHREN